MSIVIDKSPKLKSQEKASEQSNGLETTPHDEKKPTLKRRVVVHAQFASKDRGIEIEE